MSEYDANKVENQSRGTKPGESELYLRFKELENKIRLLEAERASLLIEREQYVRDLEYMRRELEQARSSPLVEASVVEVLDDGDRKSVV